MRIFAALILFFFISGSGFSQQSIVVKKNTKITEVRLDSTFSKLLVYDQLHTKLDSCIVSFEMMVEVPVENMFYGAPGGPIYKVKTPIVYKSNSAYLTAELKKAWAIHPKGKPIKFQHIYVKVGDQPQIKWRDFTIKKP